MTYQKKTKISPAHKAFLAAEKVKDEQYRQRALTEPLLKLYDQLEDYYKQWIVDSELVAVIPALPDDDPRRQTYYSSGAVSAVYLYENPQTDDPYNSPKRVFLFQGEEGKLYDFKKIHGKYCCVNRPGFEDEVKRLNEYPIVLYFKGCDDGSVGKRFKTRDEALNFLTCLDVFEDIFLFDPEYSN